MSLRADHNLRKIAAISLFLASAACLIFWMVRAFCAISFVTPYMMVTTGGEEDCLLSIWKFTEHQAVYSDPHRIPFAASYFNWGFYYFYGTIAKTCLQLLHLDIIWIPTICRLITIAFTLVTGGIFWLALRKFVNAGIFANRAVAVAWCIIVAIGPLVGFWSITTRPDMGALAFETAGLYLMLCCLRNQDDRFAVVAALLFYAAWAFKESSVTMLTGTVLALLLLKRWRTFLLLVGAWWILVIVTLVAGGPVYRECLLFAQGKIPMHADFGPKYALMAGLRSPFFLPGIAAILFFQWKRFRLHASEPIALALALVVSFSFCFALVTSCRFGNTHYFIPAAWAAMLGLALIAERMNAQWKLAGIAVCSWLLIAGIARGHIFYGNDYRYSNAIHQALAEKLAPLPGPVYVSERYGNLPWVQRLSPHFLLAYAYAADRDAGAPYENGGWEGLARDGYFGTLVMNQYDGNHPALLSRYELVDEYRDSTIDYKFYCRKASAHQEPPPQAGGLAGHGGT
ncbi:MAG: hypothetical protein WBE03_20565 [Terracidiphilus sp.]